MCGFAFLFDPGTDRGLCEQRMAACIAAMQHRGPDEGNVDGASDALLGHRRLSIIDLARSRQPMRDPSGRYLLAYNGEIYNYAEAREAIGERWQFVTEGDTEVLLAGLVLDGEAFLQDLEGMWAFALWDSQTRELLLGRDRMGKKPLFVQSLAGEGMACASELPALRRLSDRPWHEDADTTADYLRYGYAMPGTTAWREVREVLPGHCARWRPGQALAQEAWWQLSTREFQGGPKSARAELRDAMFASVERRMVADVEVGAFLSGGVDSTLVCAIVRKVLGRPLKSFTIGFEEAAFDERHFARLAADDLHTDHHAEVLAGWDEGELERLLLKHVGQPFADASLLPTALVSRVAASRVKVALSGDGGDELFSGYQRYQARNILRWYSRMPRGLRHLAERAIRRLPEPTAHHSRSVLKKAHLFLDVVGRQQAETPYVAPLMFDPATLERLAPDLRGLGHAPPGIPEQTEPDDIARMMFADALVYLPQDILVKVDRSSMAHSLETRAPFLDRKVVELAFSMPRHWHRRGFSGKRMLRESFGDLLPDTLWQRRKQGFGVPIHGWFRGELGDRLRDMAQACGNEVLRSKVVAALLDEHRSGSRDHGYRLWVLYSYLLWKGSA